MAMSRGDYREVADHLHRVLREMDPEVFELLVQHVKPTEDSRRHLLRSLEALMQIASERSGGSHGRVLDRVNAIIRTDRGSAVRGIRVVMTPEHRETWDIEAVDLARLPDRTEFIASLKRLHGAIVEDGQTEGENSDP